MTEWAAFEREYGPLGPARGDFHAATIAHAIVAVNSEKGKTPKLTDFMPDWSRDQDDARDDADGTDDGDD